jgi:hypothetical protein
MQFSEPSNISAAKNLPLDMKKWRSVIEEWDSSKENQKDYCHRLGVSLNTFTYVRGKLLQKNKIKSKFIPVTLGHIEETKNHSQNLLTLENPRGFKLHISPSLSLEQLSKIFKLSGW